MGMCCAALTFTVNKAESVVIIGGSGTGQIGNA